VEKNCKVWYGNGNRFLRSSFCMHSDGLIYWFNEYRGWEEVLDCTVESMNLSFYPG